MPFICLRADHLSGDAARAEVDAVRDAGEGEVSDACAATIASWWASEGDVGWALGRLSRAVPIKSEDVIDDILRTVGTDRPDDWNRRALDLLFSWVVAREEKTPEIQSSGENPPTRVLWYGRG
jgi:hypothetical protein